MQRNSLIKQDDHRLPPVCAAGRRHRVCLRNSQPPLGVALLNRSSNNLNRADAVINRKNPEKLDLLVLPELAFSGKSLSLGLYFNNSNRAPPQSEVHR
jgi:hypothetical protein